MAETKTTPAGGAITKKRGGGGKRSAALAKLKARATSIAARGRAEAREFRHTIVASIAAAGVGYLDGKQRGLDRQGGAQADTLWKKVPDLPVIRRVGLMGLGTAVASRFVPGKAKEYLRHAATGLLSAASYQAGFRAGNPQETVAGDDGGDDDLAGEDGAIDVEAA